MLQIASAKTVANKSTLASITDTALLRRAERVELRGKQASNHPVKKATGKSSDDASIKAV